jgi:hypothetical protein
MLGHFENAKVEFFSNNKHLILTVKSEGTSVTESLGGERKIQNCEELVEWLNKTVKGIKGYAKIFSEYFFFNGEGTSFNLKVGERDIELELGHENNIKEEK